jgi:hypothetical protein
VGLVHDPSTIAVGHLEEGCVYIDRLLTFQGSRTAPVQIATLEAALIDLAQKFSLARIRVESYQGASTVQSLQRLGLPVELCNPTPKLNAEEWPLLAQRLANGSLILFPHARLREELLNLVVEVGPTGMKVSDRGKVHQDHAVAVRGVVASLGNLGEGAGIVAAQNLTRLPTRISLNGLDDGNIAAAYAREQLSWARSSIEAEFGAGGSPEDAGPFSYGSRRGRWD